MRAGDSIDELAAIVGLSYFEGIGPVRYRALVNYFGSAAAVFRASPDELRACGMGESLFKSFDLFRKQTDAAALIKKCESKNIHILPVEDESYPARLREIPDAPFILYAMGDISLLQDELPFAVVGTRKPTPYGIEITRKIANGLCDAGFTVVSGMAMGVDAVAHSTVLEHSGRTIAVLGCGVDICYPAVNRRIYGQLQQKGLILSEFPPGMRSSKGVFPSRNRIIAGLSIGTLVTEGSANSGSLITARCAAEYGRDVCAVPGPVTSAMNAAPMVLLKEGAHPVGSADDIISLYKSAVGQKQTRTFVANLETLSDHERRIVDYIRDNGSTHIDDLLRAVNGEASDTLAFVASLEILGILHEVENGVYGLNS